MSLRFGKFLLLFCLLAGGSCKKGFLDAKPNKNLLIPAALADFDALMDNINVFNIGTGINDIGADDLYITDDGWLALSTPIEQNGYIWAKDVYAGYSFVGEWNDPYEQVFVSNVVLDGLNGVSVDSSNLTNFNRVKGSGLFHRSIAFYNLLQLFADVYDSGYAGSRAGIPIRLASDVNIPSTRATIAESYGQVIHDLVLAAQLLPLNGQYKTRPNRKAALGLLARVYLSMGDYKDAGLYADSALQLDPVLLDYNQLDSTAPEPFPQALPNNNDEILFYEANLYYSFTASSEVFVDSTLYRSYAANDLRRVLFFDNSSGQASFKGWYGGDYYSFGGIVTDELYLIRAEAAARNGNVQAAMNDLNTLLVTRYKTGTYVNRQAVDATDALGQILSERRKELVYRGLRWTDLRRLNKDPRFARTLVKVLNGQTYSLPAGDDRYTLPIPVYEINLDGIAQNPR